MNTSYTPEEVATFLKLDIRTVYRFIRSGKLEAAKLGRIYRITQSQIDSFLENSTTKPLKASLFDKKLKKIVCAIEKIKNISAAYLFGSQSAGTANKNSDVDIAILFEANNVPDEFLRLALQQDISDEIEMDCDLIVLNTSGLIVSMQVLNKGRLIVKKDEKLINRFIITVVGKYADLMFVRREMEKSTLSRRVYGG